MDAMIRTGIDLGGSKIEIASFGEDGSLLLRERVATPQGDYAGTVAAIAALVAQAEAKVMSLRARDGIHPDGARGTVIIRRGRPRAPADRPAAPPRYRRP